MSHDKIVQAIKIICDDLYEEHTELGLYSSSGTKSASTLAFGGTYSDGSPIFTVTTGDINSIPIGCKVYGTMYGGYVSVLTKTINTITVSTNASGSGMGGLSLLATVTGSPCVCAMDSTTGISIGTLVQCPTGWEDSTDRTVIDVGNTWIKLGTNATATSVTETVIYKSKSEIRLCENLLVGTVLDWATGILAKNGISTIKQSFDGSRSGSPVQYDGINVSILNTNQYILRLQELGIVLNGFTVELWEFRGTEADNDSTSADIIFTGSIQDPEWNETILSLSCPNNKYKRRAECGVIVNNDAVNGNFKKALDDQNGIIVPLTFGKFYVNDSVDPATQVKSYAKFNRVSAKQTVFTNDFSGDTVYLTPKGTNTFPVVAVGDTNSPHLAYKLKFGTGGTSGDPLTTIINAFNPSEKYIKITVGGASIADGNDSFIGVYRKIGKYAQIIGTTTSGSPIITEVSDTSNIVTGSRVTLNAGFASASANLFDWTVLDKTIDTITVSANAISNTSVTIRQGYVIDYSGLGIIICLDSFFEKNLCVSSDATAENNAWVMIVDIPFEFTADTWPCKGFIDENGDAIAATDYPRLAVYNSDSTGKYTSKFTTTADLVTTEERSLDQVGCTLIPQYGYSSVVDALKNKLIIDLKLFKNDPNQLVTYDFFQMENIIKYTNDDIVKEINGAYTNLIANTNWFGEKSTLSADEYSGSLSVDCVDRNDSTYYEQKVHSHATSLSTRTVIAVWEFDIPKDKILINYDSFYLGIDFKSKTAITNEFAPPIIIKHFSKILYKRFIGLKTASSEYASKIGSVDTVYYSDTVLSINDGFSTIKNLTDFYYLTRTDNDNNKHFYYNLLINEMSTDIGYHKNFKIPIESKENLKSIHKMYFLQGFEHPVAISMGSPPVIQIDSHTIIKRLYELALICEKSYSISKDIYAMFGGRIYNDTAFATRYGAVATDLIDNPVAILEHVKRLQNGSEYGDAVDFGKEYSPSIKIRIGAVDGSYDNLPAELYTYRPAFQIFDRDKAGTDKIAELICKRYGLCTYQDKDGYECVEDVFTKKNTIGVASTLATISLSAIVDDIGATKEPKSQDVFVNPLINYSYNPGSQKFDKNLQVLNSADSTYTKTDGTIHTAGIGWEPELTPGFQGTDGQEVWEACHALWNRFRQIELAPSDLTDCEMITTYSDALAYITKWVNRMGLRRVSFNIPYVYVASDDSWARDWHVAQHININLPHQTNGGDIECVIESIVKDKNNNIINIEVILLDDIISNFFLSKIQDCYVEIDTLEKWQDYYRNPDLYEVIQDRRAVDI